MVRLHARNASLHSQHSLLVNDCLARHTAPRPRRTKFTPACSANWLLDRWRALASHTAVSLKYSSTSSSSASIMGQSHDDQPSPIAPLDMDSRRLPKHLAIIMDGNGRWASQRKQPATFGHDHGVKALRSVVECCDAWGIPYLTVYAFSAENWRREAAEISFLFGLMERVLTQELDELAGRRARLRFVGNWNRLPQSLQNAMFRAEHETRSNDGLNLTIAISYSARQDMATAVREIAAKVACGALSPEQVDEDLITNHLSTSVLPDGVRTPDLLIRTSGEQRLSNFLLWEAAYTELLFCPVLWPDFGETQLRNALMEYASRQRRFGMRPVGHDVAAVEEGRVDSPFRLASGACSCKAPVPCGVEPCKAADTLTATIE